MKLEIEQKYITQISEMEKSCREVRAENSEFKAKQLMNAFQGQGGTGLPAFSNSSLSAMTSLNESAEI